MKVIDKNEEIQLISLNALRARLRSNARVTVQARRWLAVAVALLTLTISPGLSWGSHRQVFPQSGVVLDNTFGIGGKVLSDFGTNSFASEAAFQSDGKVVVAGYTGATVQGTFTVSGSVVARYNTDGTLDTTFGTNGLTTITTSGFGTSGIALQKDGKIVLIGATGINLGGAFLGHLALVRLNTDGSLDASFGTGGLAVDPDGGGLVGVSVGIQTDGQIVAAATDLGPSTGELVVSRYNVDGSRDLTFGTGGAVTRGLLFGAALRIQPDGKIVVAGNSFSDPTVIRLNTDGSADDTFGTSGTAEISNLGFGGLIYGMTLQSDGKIVIVGSTVPTAATPKENLLIIRCNSDGSLDQSFGAGGIVTTDFDGLNDAAASAAIQDDGEIVVAATGFASSAAQSDIHAESSAALTLFFALSRQAGNFGLVRYNADGSLDSTFGAGGKLITSFSQQSTAAALSITIQKDGKLLAAGSATVGAKTEFALARYQGNPNQTAGDFSISADQQAQSVEAGSSTSFLISTQAVAGVAPPNAIALTSSVNPANGGVTAHLSTVLVGVGGSSTLTVAAAATTAPGSYSINVSGTAGTITHNIILTVTVEAADFTLGFSQQSITGVRGTKVTITVSINRSNGFDGTVTVSSPANLPDGIKLKGSSQVATTSSSASFAFKVKGRAAVGSDPLTFTGTDANGHSESATVTLVVQ